MRIRVAAWSVHVYACLSRSSVYLVCVQSLYNFISCSAFTHTSGPCILRATIKAAIATCTPILLLLIFTRSGRLKYNEFPDQLWSMSPYSVVHVTILCKPYIPVQAHMHALVHVLDVCLYVHFGPCHAHICMYTCMCA